jgi:hypothetical protein
VQQAFSEANRIGDLTYASIAATISSRILLRTANA